MNNEQISLKEFRFIFIILGVIIVFIFGFFLGANAMKNHLTSIGLQMGEDTLTQPTYTSEEINDFYYDSLEPTRLWLKEINELFLKKDNTLSKEQITTLSEKAIEIKEKLLAKELNSNYLISSTTHLHSSIDILLDGIQSQIEPKQFEQANLEFLRAQREFYRNIWVWEQKDSPTIKDESLLNWEQWKKAKLNQKNYIVSSIISKFSIFTWYHPEDITVHLDEYLQKNEEEPIQMEDLIKVLISVNGIKEKDFLQYKKWYGEEPMPRIPNFIEP